MAAGDHSIQWSRFYCGGAVCSPTRASHLTGRSPNRVCMWDWINLATHMHLPHNEFTIAHAAAKTGHHRSFHTGKWHLVRPRTPQTQPAAPQPAEPPLLQRRGTSRTSRPTRRRARRA
eukprot:COSAG04_NODE_6754_length_1263_cov_0.741409_3_plen_118_part_00